MTLWLLGESARESSSVSFGPLPGGNQWTHVAACLTATAAFSDQDPVLRPREDATARASTP